MATNLLWLPAGRQYVTEELLHWQGRGHESFERAAARWRTVVLGPHSSAAFPAELRPFVAAGLTRRQQFDYSDVVTGALGRAWALADPEVVFVENPHSRLVLDPNRAPPAQPIEGLREFWSRLARQRAGESGESFAGVDAIRPITFAGADVLLAPRDAAGWAAIGDALARCAAQGPLVYAAAARQVIGAIRASSPARGVLVISLHDTMNAKIRADGAIADERAPADRLPAWVNFGNLGDERGEPSPATAPISLDPGRMRALAAAWASALGAADDEISLNRPYKGAYETQAWGRELGQRAGSGAVQVEFRREALLGPALAAHLRLPGHDWPAFDSAHIGRVAQALAQAGGAYWAAA
jgi:hypothetical protein